MPSVTEIPQGTNDLVRSLPNNPAPGGRFWMYDIGGIRYRRAECRHSYSRVAIVDYLRRGTKQCPMPGCGQLVSLHGLQRNEELEAGVRAAQRREVVATQMSVDVSDEDDEAVG